ncbi:MAG: MmgE/PrpD family protein [Burkholderiales bacterium]
MSEMSRAATPLYLRELATFLAGTTIDALPEQARTQGRMILADTIPVIGAGMREPEMRALRERVLACAGAGRAWVIGARLRACARDAVMLNGTASTWLELNEGNLRPRGHPSVQVVPAAIAEAQVRDASGSALLLAIVLGYEACSRIGRAAQVKLAVHPHGTWGVIGAAVAVGTLRGFSTEQFVTLINCAATLGLATSRTTLLEGATVRNPFTGHSGQMGLLAADLVECGFTGQSDGPGTIYTEVLADQFDAASVTEGLGVDWLITQGYFKLHPTGRYVHAAFDAFDDALRGLPGDTLRADDIDRIDVRAYKLAAMLKGQSIDSSFGARFSIPFGLATRVVHGHTRLPAFEMDAVSNPVVQALARRIFVTEDPAHTAAYPATQRCDVRIRLHDGRALSGHCEIMRGEPENPHSADALRQKFFDLAVPLWGEEWATTLHKGCMKIEDIDHFGQWSDRIDL